MLRRKAVLHSPSGPDAVRVYTQSICASLEPLITPVTSFSVRPCGSAGAMEKPSSSEPAMRGRSVFTMPLTKLVTSRISRKEGARPPTKVAILVITVRGRPTAAHSYSTRRRAAPLLLR